MLGQRAAAKLNFRVFLYLFGQRLFGISEVGKLRGGYRFVGEDIDSAGNVFSALGNALNSHVIFHGEFHVDVQGFSREGAEGDVGIPSEEMENRGRLDTVVEGKVYRTLGEPAARHL